MSSRAADALVPEAWGRELARRIPEASITCYLDQGHFIAPTRRRAVLEYLVGGLRSLVCKVPLFMSSASASSPAVACP